ncbi:MAG: HAD-IA family hydrolase [Proteobacteria bacterium]|nr:HAD-IA family hydrolase [Pseudomonadota bacterium]
MTQIFTILFDLDGTIIDTAPDLIVAHDHVMKKFGHKIEQSVDIKKNVGRGAWMMMQKSLKEKNVNQVIRNEMTKEFIDFYSKNIANGSKPIKGLLEFLDWAKSKNISMAICTNKQERLAVQLLKKLNLFDYFEYIAGHDTFAFNKPDPRHLTNVVEIIGGDLKKTIMVGDSEIDEMAAVNAKLPFVLIANGYTEKRTEQIKHDVLIKDFIGFDKIISKYL